MRKLLSLSPAEQRITEIISRALPLAGAAQPLPPVGAEVWPELVECADFHGLGPLLYAAVKPSGRLAAVPAPARDRLRLAATRSGYANGLAFEELGRLLDLFERENIPVVLLKGSALAVTIYPDRGWRPLGDLDLFIRSSDAARVRALLEEAGYTCAAEMHDGFQRHFSFEETFLRGRPNPAQVDIHWHLIENGYYRARVPVDWFWERTEQIRVDGRPARVLRPDANLLYLAAHFILHHHGERLIWSYDLARLLSFSGGEIEWAGTVAAAERFGLSRPLLTALELVSRAWGVQAPEEVMGTLSRSRGSWHERLALTAIGAPHSDARFLLDALESPGAGGKLAYYARVLFPARAYMMQRYRPRDARLLPLYYAARPIQLSYKLARSVLSLAVPRA